MQVWSSTGPDQQVKVGDSTISTTSTFRIVGMVLGTSDVIATSAHCTPRLQKALLTARRLQALPLPAAPTALLWRTTVLPQALYGCEIRSLRPSQLSPLLAIGKALLGLRHPLHLQLASPRSALRASPW